MMTATNQGEDEVYASLKALRHRSDVSSAA